MGFLQCMELSDDGVFEKWNNLVKGEFKFNPDFFEFFSKGSLRIGLGLFEI